MDRQYLAAWSLDVPDDAFPSALAALGALAALSPAQVGAVLTSGAWMDALRDALTEAEWAAGGVLPWALPTLHGRQQAVMLRMQPTDGRATSTPAPEAALLAKVWHDWLAQRPQPDPRASRGPRLALRPAPARRLAAQALAPLLARPEVGAASVFFDGSFTSDGRTRWQWPFTIAALPGDPAVAALAERQRWAPRGWPFRFVTASRDTPRVEVLAISAAAAPALARLIDSGLSLHACLVVVAGLGGEAPNAADPVLRALVARLSAEGVAAFNPAGDANDWAQRLWTFGYELTHDQPLDVALTLGFGPGLLLLNHDLLALSRLDTTVGNIVGRLRRLPPDVRVAMSAPAIDHLRVRMRMRPMQAQPAPPADLARPTARAMPAPRPADLPAADGTAPPSELADAIEAARPNYAYLGESHEAAAVSELSRRVRHHEAAAARAASPRFVNQTSWRREAGRLQPQRRGYVLGRPVLVRVDIGPRRTRGSTAHVPFPEDLLPRDQDRHELQLVLHEPRQMDAPLTATIELRATGRSTPAEFSFTPRTEGPFEARLSVLHRGRVLQTLLLHTQVAANDDELRQRNSRITLDEEAWVRHDWSDLGSRRHFDMALVFNHSIDGQPRATGIAEGCAWATDLSGIQEPLNQINDAISGVATNVTDYASGLDQGKNPGLLVKLARAGTLLYSRLYRDQLGANTAGGLDVASPNVQSIQVVTLRADEVVPIEFIYDFDAPSSDAQVCPQHAKALTDGQCPGDCARHGNRKGYVCPMGFWGLKKEIERHQFNRKVKAPAGYPLVVQSEPADQRDHLDLSGGVIVGHSREVEHDQVTSLVQKLGAVLGHPVSVVADWDAWKAAVKDDKPAVLVAFPHNQVEGSDAALEIGGKLLDTLGLDSEYVHTPDGPPQPVVLLLGCDTAGTAELYANHVIWFRQAGAAVVVGTIATVFGEHAVGVGDEIVSALLQPAEQHPRRIAEVIRDAKRHALLNSRPMALCVVAFGDADWQL